MKVVTKYHGTVEITDKEILTFQKGLPGFIEEKKFILLPLDKESPFWILQSVTTIELGFIVVNPFSFFPDYEFEISENVKQLLELKSEKDVVVWTILTIKEQFEDSTANLQAPIILNTSNNHAKQLILNDSKYKTKQQLFPEKITK